MSSLKGSLKFFTFLAGLNGATAAFAMEGLSDLPHNKPVGKSQALQGGEQPNKKASIKEATAEEFLRHLSNLKEGFRKVNKEVRGEWSKVVEDVKSIQEGSGDKLKKLLCEEDVYKALEKIHDKASSKSVWVPYETKLDNCQEQFRSLFGEDYDTESSKMSLKELYVFKKVSKEVKGEWKNIVEGVKPIPAGSRAKMKKLLCEEDVYKALEKIHDKASSKSIWVPYETKRDNCQEQFRSLFGEDYAESRKMNLKEAYENYLGSHKDELSAKSLAFLRKMNGEVKKFLDDLKKCFEGDNSIQIYNRLVEKFRTNDQVKQILEWHLKSALTILSWDEFPSICPSERSPISRDIKRTLFPLIELRNEEKFAINEQMAKTSPVYKIISPILKEINELKEKACFFQFINPSQGEKNLEGGQGQRAKERILARNLADIKKIVSDNQGYALDCFEADNFAFQWTEKEEKANKELGKMFLQEVLEALFVAGGDEIQQFTEVACLGKTENN